MKRTIRFISSLAFLMASTLQPMANGADTSTASFNISGTVPSYFSVSTRGIASDLDLSPNVIVNNRRIGLMHLKYNMNVASLTIASSTASGQPEGATGTYSFQGGFKVAIAAGCFSVDAAYNTPFVLTTAGTDVKSVGATALTAGVEEDCDVTASWKGTASALPIGGSYGLNISVTMVSQ